MRLITKLVEDEKLFVRVVTSIATAVGVAGLLLIAVLVWHIITR